ncbi:MAG: alanine racemase, partial [Alphaproteobacteria bacterium]|nr:alanine racemase [Alphaproteobacteria bacterium]
MDFQKVLDKVAPQVLSVAVINLDNIAYNYHKVEDELAKGSIVSAVVKGNSYGFGAIPVSKRLYEEGCRNFFVATIDEG